VFIPSTNSGSKQVVGGLGDQVNVVTVEDKDKLNSFDVQNLKVSSVSELIAGTFNFPKSAGWYV
jgi:hypothetical protein